MRTQGDKAVLEYRCIKWLQRFFIDFGNKIEHGSPVWHGDGHRFMYFLLTFVMQEAFHKIAEVGRDLKRSLGPTPC